MRPSPRSETPGSPRSTGSFLHDRAIKEREERAALAPYASFSADCSGRRHAEEEDDLRTPWERDRDRLIHSTSFRRLMYKTQVFVNWEGDHFRTRLSHTMEVGQVARSAGSALALNEPLCEVLALGHDLGHPPFGHGGERVLNALMADYGGFRHNAQVLRVVDLLERRSPDYPGLNLTREVRESLLKNEDEASWPVEFRPRSAQARLEAQVVDLADSTAYHVHDLEDGLSSSIFTEDQLGEAVALWSGAREAVDLRHPGFLAATRDERLRVKRITNELLKICINDLIQSTRDRLQDSGIQSAEDARRHPAALVGHGPAIAREVEELGAFLLERFYRHPRLLELEREASRILEALFAAYCEKPDEMPRWYRAWVEQVGLERAVCDYLAGMTDRYAEREHGRLA